jgi:glutamine synthetase
MPGLTQELTAQGVEYVRFVWCDSANVLRAKVVPIQFLRGVFSRGVGISYAQQGVPVVRDAFVAESGLGPVGEARLVADWSSLVVLPYCDGHARVIGNMVVKGKPWEHCPRAFLRRMIQKASSHGIHIQAGFENEFYLLEQTESGPRPIDDTLFCDVHGLNRNAEFLTQFVTNLKAQGSRVILFHPESGGGQFELAMHHAEPMIAADQQVTFRETIHAVAHQNGYLATFLPKPFPDRAGSGCHIHLSLWKDGKNITDLSQEEDETSQHFVAGILKHLPALMALTTPSNNSYARLGRHLWSGGFACWGYDNREAALRMPTAPHGVSHFEFKTHDATANPYIALGGILAAGLDGVEKKMALPDPVDVDPGLLDAKDRKAKKIKELPKGLKTVLNALEKSKVLKEALGPDLTRSYLAVKREEFASISKMDPADEVELLLQRY